MICVQPNTDGTFTVKLTHDAAQRFIANYAAGGEEHFDVIEQLVFPHCQRVSPALIGQHVPVLLRIEACEWVAYVYTRQALDTALDEAAKAA